MIEEPATISGEKLAELRKGYGVSREAVARHLGLHRNTIRKWETAPTVNVIRQRRYAAALRELIEKSAA